MPAKRLQVRQPWLCALAVSALDWGCARAGWLVGNGRTSLLCPWLRMLLPTLAGGLHSAVL
jgi:hypothetical protein